MDDVFRRRKSLVGGLVAVSLAGAALAGAGGALSADDVPPTARGIGAILPGGNVASAQAGPRNPTRSARGVPSGPVASGGSVSVRVGAGPGGRARLAEAVADASGVSLFGGRIVVNALRVGVRSETGDGSTTAGVADWSADVSVNGQAIEEQPGAPVDVPGVGTLVLVERLVEGGVVTANALRLEITDPSTGFAPGTQVVIGRVEARTGEQAPESPSPDPGSAPSAPGAATPSADGVTTPPSIGGRALPVAPTTTRGGTPGDFAPAATSPVAPSLGVPRRDPGSAAGIPTTQGYAFPVLGDGISYGDDYGDPRAGTGWHHGTDLFGPMGTPLVAVADGTLSKVGVNTLGGNRLWLTDDAGNEYYYAHLSAFAPGAADGTRVRAGQVIGFLGNTGQAITTPPHLHFEIHPGGGDSVNPYPYLVAWERNAAVPQAFVAATVATGHVPAAGALLLGSEPIDDQPDAGSTDGLATPVR